MAAERLHKMFPVFLTVIIIVLYAHTFGYGFLHYWDNEDYSYIEGNKLISSFDSETLTDIFFTSFDNHYHPLTLLSLGLDYQISGLATVTFRITNIILFICISLFIFFFVRKLSGNFYASAFVSLFFALHPFNVESVLWLSERKNLLFVFFLFPALTFYLSYIDSGRYKLLLLSSLFFLLSLLSKSQGLPFVGLIFILDIYRGRKIKFNLITEKIPILIAGGLFLYLTFYFHQPENFIRAHPESMTDYFFAGFRNLFFYSGHSLLPIGLSAYYPYPGSETLAGVFWYYPLLILLFAFIIFRYGKKNRLLILGILFFLISIFPLLKFFSVPYGNYISADRYMILPLAGVGIALWAIYGQSPEKYRKALKYIAACMLVFFCISTYSLTRVWKDDISFYSRLVEKYPDLRSAIGNRGRVYMAAGKYNEAIEDFTQLIHIAPDYPNAYLNRGLAYIRAQKPAKAYYDFSAAIRFDPASYKAYNNRALLLMNMKQLPEAKADILKALEINPGFTEAWVNKSLIEMNSGETDSSLYSLNKAIETGFNDADLINYIRKQTAGKE